MPKDSLKEKLRKVVFAPEPFVEEEMLEQIISLIQSELNETIPEIVRDLTALPTQGLPKSKAKRIIETKLKEL